MLSAALSKFIQIKLKFDPFFPEERISDLLNVGPALSPSSEAFKKALLVSSS